MKKLLSLILLLIIIFSIAFYQGYIKKGNEEIEILNADVSVNNIKSIVDIKNENNDDYEEIPLGYNDGCIYLIKYDPINKKLYDNNIFILNEDGSTKACGIKLPDNYSNGQISIYSDKIFGKDGYFNWQSGKEYKLLSNEEDALTTNWYSVSGSKDYYLCIKESTQKKKYILFNISSNDEYKFECSFDSEDVISGVFYDDATKKNYVVCQNGEVKEINFDGVNFTLEKYDDIKINNKDTDNKNKDLVNSYLNYSYCSEGHAYIGYDNNDKAKAVTSITQYDITGRFIEPLSNITLYGYDSFYKEYILIKKDDENSSNKIYLVKLERDGFDMLIEIPKIYGDNSIVSIHKVDSENVLIKEEIHDKENKKIKNRYLVYDLAEYFQENIGKAKSDNDKITLKNAYKNINEYSDYDNKSKVNVNEENKDVKENEQPKLKGKDDNETTSTTREENDYREHDSSWRKGNGEWYYYKDNDEIAIGWVKTAKGWYYFYKDGVMQKDAIVIGKNGKEYKLGHDGLLLNPDSELYYDEDKEKNPKGNNNNEKINSNTKDKEDADDKEKVKNTTENKGATDDKVKSNNNTNN